MQYIPKLDGIVVGDREDKLGGRVKVNILDSLVKLRQRVGRSRQVASEATLGDVPDVHLVQ